MTKLRALLEFTAGSAIGLLVGLIAGLSISPVTSTILGALSTGLLILLGFKESKERVQAESHAIRVLGFGLLCSVSLVAGIIVRTHQSLSPPLEKQNQRLTDLRVFTPSQIQQILLSTNFAIEPAVETGEAGGRSRDELQNSVDTHTAVGDKKHPAPSGPQKASADLAYAGLLRAGSAEFCQVARREQFKDAHAYVDFLRTRDPRLADVIASAPAGYQDPLSKSLSAYLCP